MSVRRGAQLVLVPGMSKKKPTRKPHLRASTKQPDVLLNGPRLASVISILRILKGMSAVNQLDTCKSETANRKCCEMNSRSVPLPGDVVASRATARSDEYSISILPDAAFVMATRYAEAIATVRQRAGVLRVDGWYTADHTHFVRVARCRP